MAQAGLAAGAGAALNPAVNAPYNVCNGSAGATTATLQVTVGTGAWGPQGSAAGDLVYVLAAIDVTGASFTSVTDSQGHAYTAVPGASNLAGRPAALYAALTTHPLVAGTDWVQLTCSVSTGQKFLIARGCPGVLSVAADTAANANSSLGTLSAAPSSGATGTLSQASELVIGGIVNAGGGGAPSGVSFGTALTISYNAFVTVFDEIVTGTAPQTASGTLAKAVLWSAVIASFKLATKAPFGVLAEQSAAMAATTPFGALAEQSASSVAATAPFGGLTEQSAGLTVPGGTSVPAAFAASGTRSWSPYYLRPSNGSGTWTSQAATSGYPAVYGPVYT